MFREIITLAFKIYAKFINTELLNVTDVGTYVYHLAFNIYTDIIISVMAPDLPFTPCNTNNFPSVEYVTVLKTNRVGSVEKMVVNHNSVGNALLSVTIRRISAYFSESHNEALEILEGSLVTYFKASRWFFFLI